jgi:hypothetical protein
MNSTTRKQGIQLQWNAGAFATWPLAFGTATTASGARQT